MTMKKEYTCPVCGDKNNKSHLLTLTNHKRIPVCPHHKYESYQTLEKVIEKKTMTIGETKIGCTMVLSKGDCAEMGFAATSTTKEVIKEVRAKLGLPEKAIRE